MSLKLKRVLRNYDTFLEFLKFAVRNNEDPQFKDYSLVKNYIELLEDLEKDINKQLSAVVLDDENRLEFSLLTKSIFKQELSEYKKYINCNEKEELIRKFQVLMVMSDIVLDRHMSDDHLVKTIDYEIGKYKTLAEPLLKVTIYR